MKKEALLYERIEKGRVHCFLCGHHCRIAPDTCGVCGVRKNIDGVLYSLVYARPVALQRDPIEKKPLYHFLPGSSSFSIATAGCNFTCGFCQNWQISQEHPDRAAQDTEPRFLPPRIVADAKKSRCASISYTYTEPTVFFEYAYDISRLAKQAGLYNVFVTNGFLTKEAVDTIAPFLDAANIDLKSFREAFYRSRCKGRLAPVLETIAYMRRKKIWVEVTTLVIPGENDSEEELTDIARFLAGISPDIPWHISRFHPDYTFTGYRPTTPQALAEAKEIGHAAGLRYVYLGNIGAQADTVCYRCRAPLITRSFFEVQQNRIKDGACPDCGTVIDGVWRG